MTKASWSVVRLMCAAVGFVLLIAVLAHPLMNSLSDKMMEMRGGSPGEKDAFSGLTLFLMFWVGCILISGVYIIEGLIDAEDAFRADSSLERVDVVIDGKRLIGANAKVVARCESEIAAVGPLRISHLCQTNTGQWFEHNIQVPYGPQVEQRFKFITEVEAKDWLAGNIELYEKNFGKREVA
ncbi:hypothetical protein [Delftia sp. JD2]|uniref:hypothetical protein n=1 Tax=Delftia sp. JD2 TaxID=469553 RepID=UPI001111FDE5|nr:hypothetical protein [Delftia sp. JD2]